MTHYFISDCHFQENAQAAVSFFIRFLDETVKTQGSSLHLLGDFFELWVGDDVIEPWQQPIINAIRAVSDAGIPVTFMVGNRDFLIGEHFCNQCGMKKIKDPHLVTLAGQQTLLMHGDLLCTDDVAYQRFRRWVRLPIVKWVITHLPKTWRYKLAHKARAKSKQHTRTTALEIMDVNTETVDRYIEKFQASLLIHGHTHRPTHETRITASGHNYQRIVLGDWHQQASIAEINSDNEIALKTYSFD